jgi:hypothetical protein
MNSSMVLQQKPAKAAVYGYYDPAAKSPKITITVLGGSSPPTNGTLSSAQYTVIATVDGKGRWKAYLKPAAAGGSYQISAICSGGCTGTATIKDVTFGDVW